MHKKKKLILIVIFILTSLIINIIIPIQTYAITQILGTEIDKIDEQKYPGFKQMIQSLQEKHPNWNFKILYTDLDWNEVIKNEYVGHGASPSNLVPVGTSYSGEWICESCTANKYYDNGSWRCASEKTLKYMMDARNSINENDLFQFMELTYQECTLEKIKPMVIGTFLENDSYINAIIEAGKNYNVSPYYIVALAIQEQGAKGSSTISGNYAGYEGYYNIFNINASGNGNGTIITNALDYAKKNGWTTIEKSIDGGVKKISTSYISKGQNTLYLQKFDVDNTDGDLYWHQYQQNVMAAQYEGETIRETFEEINAIDSAYTFVIPVYENMPQEKSEKPKKETVIDTTNTEKVQLNVKSSINLRATPNGEVIGKLYADEIVYRLEKATGKYANTYWDKVMKENGVIGYVARETYDYEPQYKLYLVPIEETPENPEQPSDEPSDEPTDEPESPNSGTTELPTINNEKIKIQADTKQVTIIPQTTAQEIINLVGVDITITDKDGNQLDKTATIGTGCKINGYTLVMLGDSNGDGFADAIDLLLIKRQILGTNVMENEYKKSMDLNKDNLIDAIDLLLQKRQILGTQKITI